MLPRKLGRYELIATLAKGGMGQVYLACTRGPGGFERLVVVKCALPESSDNREQNLLAEARIAATLQHTNIVQVHDVGIEDGVVFIAMEYLHGQDVAAILSRAWGTKRPLGLDPALAIALSMCSGLHYAHEKRDSDGSVLELVHRDVSPSNVIVTYDGGVKIIDFGIAKATSLPSETQLGTVKGKPGYMSPEQCRSEPLDRRSDVFCLGIVLYELTTGIRPFAGDSAYEIAKAIVELEPVWPRTIDSAYPAELEAVARRALAKDRRDRFPTAQAMHDELATLASRQRLDVSQFALQRAMTSLFQGELDAWHAAQANEQAMVDFAIQRTASNARRPALFSETEEATATVVAPMLPVAAVEPQESATNLAVQRIPRSRARLYVAGAVVAALVVGGLVLHFATRSAPEAVPATKPTAVEPPPAVVAPPDAAIPVAVPPVAVPIDAGISAPLPAVPHHGNPPTTHVDHSHHAGTKHVDPDEIIR
jgi:hypothetical protein